MNSARRYLLIALSFAICMTVFAAFAPRIAHAVTATLVQVANGPGNPVITVSGDDGGRQPFQFNQVRTGGVSFSFSVPAGKTLVLEHLNIFCFVTPGQFTDYRLDNEAGGTFAQYIFLPSLSPDGSELALNQATRIYADGGSNVVLSQGSINVRGECLASVSGHFINPL
jgi:hypothetical protein